MSEVAVQVCDVSKSFDSRKILDAVRLDVLQGETLVILGGSGSGKSTLLRLMIGNLRPESGQILAFGKNICGMSAEELKDYRKSIGVLFQSGALFNSMSIADNVALPLREHTNLAEETIAIMVKIKLELVGLREDADKMPAQLSGGMKKLRRARSGDCARPQNPVLRRAQRRPGPRHHCGNRPAHLGSEPQARRHQRRRHA